MAPRKKIESFSEIYAKYLFVAQDASRGFGAVSAEAKKMVNDRQKELLEELYVRVYGYNPFKKFPLVINGKKPEDVDLDQFVVAKNTTKEPEDEMPQTFVIAPPPSKEEG